MLIYKDEKDIAELIQGNQTIAYLCKLEEADQSEIPQRILASAASIYKDTPNTPDLYFTKSILVSSTINKNDDYFPVDHTWAARKTPVDKPMNIEHDHSKVIGHITSSWAIDQAHNILAEDLSVEDLPPLIHLCISSVIYKKWQKEDIQEEVDDLIAGIKANEVFVSMEALFSNFSYLLFKDDEHKLVERTSATAFLSKHLRAYGGSGQYDGYKVARAILNPIFSACGYVKKPANPDSIIFSNVIFPKSEEKHKIFLNSGVTPNKEEIIMSDNILEKQIAELKEQVKQLTLANKELSDEVATASVEKYEAEIASLRDQIVALQKTLADAEANVQSVETAKSALADELKGLNDKYASVVAELDEVRKGAVLAARTSKLVEIGLSKEEAEVKAKSLVALSDEQFESLASIIASVKPPVVPGTNSAPAVPGTQEAPAVTGSEEEVEVESEEDDVDATVASESDDSELFAVFAAYCDEVLSKEKK